MKYLRVLAILTACCALSFGFVGCKRAGSGDAGDPPPPAPEGVDPVGTQELPID